MAGRKPERELACDISSQGQHLPYLRERERDVHRTESLVGFSVPMAHLALKIPQSQRSFFDRSSKLPALQ
jgi:hypothetical protein